MEVFLASCLQDVVILQVPAGGVQAVIVPAGRITVRVFKQVILQFRGGHGRKPLLGGLVDLGLEERAGSDRERLVRLPHGYIADHDGRPVQPGCQPQGVVHRLQVHVPIALFPVGKVIACYRLHFHVHREQVIAAVGSMGCHRVKEKPGIIARMLT